MNMDNYERVREHFSMWGSDDRRSRYSALRELDVPASQAWEAARWVKVHPADLVDFAFVIHQYGSDAIEALASGLLRAPFGAARKAATMETLLGWSIAPARRFAPGISSGRQKYLLRQLLKLACSLKM